jgi:hypothetical protein
VTDKPAIEVIEGTQQFRGDTPVNYVLPLHDDHPFVISLEDGDYIPVFSTMEKALAFTSDPEPNSMGVVAVMAPLLQHADEENLGIVVDPTLAEDGTIAGKFLLWGSGDNSNHA